MTENKLLSNFQFGFRKNHSTIDALVSIQYKVYQALNYNMKCVLVSLDLSKAFQTVNIELLQDKLFQIGCDDKCLKWFRSYLGNRYQFVKFKKKLSKIRRLNLGTAQGSILGCLLFAIFINDITNLDLNGMPVLFADDMSLIIIAKNYEDLETKVNEDLTKINNWLNKNKLFLNQRKSNFMIIGRPPKNIDIPVFCGNNQLQRVYSTKILGITIDNNMNFGHHLENTCK